MSNYSSALVFLESLAGYVICGLVAILGFVVIWLILTSRIDLSHLLSEKDGSGASMSRFQLLIFIFVIALSFFLVVIANIKILQAKGSYDHLPVLPDVPNGVPALLGISASSYAVSKAIQHGAGKSGNARRWCRSPRGRSARWPTPRRRLVLRERTKANGETKRHPSSRRGSNTGPAGYRTVHSRSGPSAPKAYTCQALCRGPSRLRLHLAVRCDQARAPD